MTGIAIMLKSMGLDLSPEGLKKLLTETGIGAKIEEAQGIVSGFIKHIDDRFNSIEHALLELHKTDAKESRAQHAETHRQLELMNMYLENLTVKISQMHEDILDKGAAGAHTVEGAVLIDPLAGFELAPIEEKENTDGGSDPKPN